MEDQEFSVNDRRIQHDREAAAEPAKSAPDSASAPGESRDPSHDDVAGFSMEGDTPPIDFAAFVFSLGHASLMCMGLEQAPSGEEVPLNLAAARQNIDILAMLEEKTRGNLSDEEGEFIGKLLYTLRMSFVEVSKTQSTA